MDNSHSVYKETLASRIHGKKISVYGIANYDIIFDLKRSDLEKLKIGPEFDNIKNRAIKDNIYKEYNRDSRIIEDAIEKLKNYPSRTILGGNATNISLGLAKLGNEVTLNIRSASPKMREELKSSGIKKITARKRRSSIHLIIQVKEASDRFIISPDYGKEEPELVYNQEKSDFAVYSGAHLDAKNPEVQKELIRRLKSISENSPIYIELGSGSRMSQDNCRKVSRYADILGMNEQEIEDLTGIEDIETAAKEYRKTHMKEDSILIIHTREGILAHAKYLPKGIEKALALGSLEGTSRYINGRYNSIEELNHLFKKFDLYNTKKTKDCMIWLPSIRYEGPGMSVGTGDGFVAGFITGYLNFCLLE